MQHIPVTLSSCREGDPLHLNHLHSSRVKFLFRFPKCWDFRATRHKISYFQDSDEIQFHFFFFNDFFGVISSHCAVVVAVQPPRELQSAVLVKQHNAQAQERKFCITAHSQSRLRRQNTKVGHICGLKTVSPQIKSC